MASIVVSSVFRSRVQSDLRGWVSVDGNTPADALGAQGLTLKI